jgi:hypothetical protein
MDTPTKLLVTGILIPDVCTHPASAETPPTTIDGQCPFSPVQCVYPYCIGHSCRYYPQDYPDWKKDWRNER